MRIVSLKAQNFKRLEAVEIIPQEDGIIMISGNNDQGKTSVIDAIISALKTTEVEVKIPIKEGAERAEVIVELDDLIVERIWTANDKSYLKVKTLDGAVYPSPQSILDKMINTLTLDPLDFLQKKPLEQVDTLLKIVKFDVSPTTFDNQINATYEERKLINRDFEKFRRILDELPEPELNLPDEEIDLIELSQQKNLVVQENKEIASKKAELKKAYEYYDQVIKNISVTDNKIKALLSQLEELKQGRINLNEEAKVKSEEVRELEKVVETLPTEEQQLDKLDSIDFKMREAQVTNQKIMTLRKRVVIENERDDAYAKSQELTAKIEELKSKKAEILSKAEFPIDGLGFDDNGVTYQGLPFTQASGSDQLKISLAIAMAMNPELKVIFSKHGDVFDDNKIKVIQEIVKDKGYQLWLEKIHPGDMPCVYIEDGKQVK